MSSFTSPFQPADQSLIPPLPSDPNMTGPALKIIGAAGGQCKPGSLGEIISAVGVFVGPVSLIAVVISIILLIKIVLGFLIPNDKQPASNGMFGAKFIFITIIGVIFAYYFLGLNSSLIKFLC